MLEVIRILMCLGVIVLLCALLSYGAVGKSIVTKWLCIVGITAWVIVIPFGLAFGIMQLIETENNKIESTMITVEELKELGFEIASNDDDMLFATYYSNTMFKEVIYYRSIDNKSKDEIWDERLSVGRFDADTGSGEYLTKEEIEEFISYFK